MPRPPSTSGAPYCLAHLLALLLLLLAGPGNTSALGPGTGRVRAGAEGRVGAVAEGRGRSGGRDRAGDRLKDSVSSLGTDTGEDGRVWREPGAGAAILSTGRGGSSRCVPVPLGMALCQGIGYDTMRMPNLLGHESPAEAVQQSASWLPLLARECHPDARIFLCSLFAPICLDR